MLVKDQRTLDELYIFRVPIGIDAAGHRIDHGYHLICIDLSSPDTTQS